MIQPIFSERFCCRGWAKHLSQFLKFGRTQPLIILWANWAQAPWLVSFKNEVTSVSVQGKSNCYSLLFVVLFSFEFVINYMYMLFM